MTPRRRGRCPPNCRRSAAPGSRCSAAADASPGHGTQRRSGGGGGGAPRSLGPDGDGGPTSRVPAPPPSSSPRGRGARVSAARLAARSLRLRDPRPPPPLSMPGGRRGDPWPGRAHSRSPARHPRVGVGRPWLRWRFHSFGARFGAPGGWRPGELGGRCRAQGVWGGHPSPASTPCRSHPTRKR